MFADLHATREVLWLRQFQACPSPRADLLGGTKCPGEMGRLEIDWMLNLSNEFHSHEQRKSFSYQWLRTWLGFENEVGVTRKKARLPAHLWEKEQSPGARKRSKSTKPTAKCCSYTLFSRYVLAHFKSGHCPDVELQPFDHPNPLPCGRFCNSDSDCGLNNPLKCCASGCGTLCRHPGKLF